MLCKDFLHLILLFLISLISLSCNQPFQPEVQYTPELNVYSVLFANAQAVYVRVTPVVQSPSDVAQLVHGASVKLVGTGLNNTTAANVTLTDTTASSMASQPHSTTHPLILSRGESIRFLSSRTDIPLCSQRKRPIRLCHDTRSEYVFCSPESEACADGHQPDRESFRVSNCGVRSNDRRMQRARQHRKF